MVLRTGPETSRVSGTLHVYFLAESNGVARVYGVYYFNLSMFNLSILNFTTIHHSEIRFEMKLTVHQEFVDAICPECHTFYLLSDLIFWLNT